jgi:hypothetical protein
LFGTVANNSENFAALLLTAQKMIGVVAYNGDNFSALLPTTGKRTLISVHVHFSALLPTTPIIVLRCGPQRGKMINVVAYTAEKLSALLKTTQKKCLYSNISTNSKPYANLY